MHIVLHSKLLGQLELVLRHRCAGAGSLELVRRHLLEPEAFNFQKKCNFTCAKAKAADGLLADPARRMQARVER